MALLAQIKNLVIMLLLISLTLINTGCNQQDKKIKNVQTFISSIKQTKGKPVEPLPQITTPELSQNKALQKRNPFSPAIENQKIQPDTQHTKGPLESFPLSQLHFVGVLSQKNQIWALISSPDGAIYNIAIGQYIGQNYGKVSQITNKEITIQETLSDGLGGWTVHTKELPLTTNSQQDAPP